MEESAIKRESGGEKKKEREESWQLKAVGSSCLEPHWTNQA